MTTFWENHTSRAINISITKEVKQEPHQNAVIKTREKPTKGSYQQNNPYLKAAELLNTPSDLLRKSVAYKLSSSRPKQSSTIDLGLK